MAMPEIVLQTSDELIARIANEKDPVKAIIEIIWNAVDAEAWKVGVVFDREPSLDSITAVHIEDDGHGISPDEVEMSFKRVWDSWKLNRSKTKNDVRGLHGSRGEGRLRAFALGNRIKWQSNSRDSTGTTHAVQITGDRSNRTRFHWDSDRIFNAERGTIFSACNEKQVNLNALQSEVAMASIGSGFAPVLLNEPELHITIDGNRLDPTKEIASDLTIDIHFASGPGEETAQLRIIEWRHGTHRMIYYGADPLHFTFEESGRDAEGHFSYSAYIVWPGFGQRTDYMQLGELAPEPLNDLWRAVREAIHDYFTARRGERRREQVQAWKESGIYPYSGEPDSAEELAERAVFDVISGTLSGQIPRTNRASARLTLALLRDAIRHDPDRLSTILHEVVALRTEDRDALTALLAETTLPAMIRSANLIANRHKFLMVLEHLLFDPDDSPNIGERDHLHHLLERELWIFGEGYNMMNSERGLTQLLRTHLKLSELPDKKVRPVKRWDGSTGRVDLHLAARAREHDRIRHLIVELKAPGVVIGRKHLDQVEDYCNAILTNPQFKTGASRWDIILVGTDLDGKARNRILKSGPELGLFLAPEPEVDEPQVSCYVRRWRDVIDENSARLDFLTTVMRHDPSIKEGLDYVRERYADILPENIAENDPEE